MIRRHFLLGLALVAGLFSTQTSSAQQLPRLTVAEIAIYVNSVTGEFSTLLAALERADLVDALDGRQHVTVFAPTDAAFAALGLNPGNIDSVPVEDLTDILLYHVTSGRRLARNLAALNGGRVRMLNGDTTRVRFDRGSFRFFVNQSTIVIPNLVASNGAIHVIDTVLIPPAQ